MSEERDDLLREIGEALRVEPGAAFGRGVRARIGHSRPRRSYLTWTAMAAASLTVFAIGIWPAGQAKLPYVAVTAGDAPLAPVAPAPPTESPFVAISEISRSGRVHVEGLAWRTTHRSALDVQVEPEYAARVHVALGAIAEGRLTLFADDLPDGRSPAIPLLELPAAIEIPAVDIEPLPAIAGS